MTGPDHTLADAPPGVPIGIPVLADAPVPVPVPPGTVTPVIPPPRVISLLHVLLAVTTWVLLYVIGIAVAAGPYVRLLNEPGHWTLTPVYFGVILVSHSLSNIAILCCLATLIGGGCSPKHDEPSQVLLGKGLLVYLTAMTGVLVVTTSPFDHVSQADYVRIASAASMLAFVVGYYPEKFESLLGKAADRLDRPAKPS